MKNKMFYLNQQNIAPGTAPGTINLYENAAPPEVCLRAYDKENLVEYNNININNIEKTLSDHKDKNIWLNINGFGSLELLEKITNLFQIHKLSIEDIVNNHQRPKIDEYDNHLFIVFQIPVLDGEHLKNEQLSMFIGDHYLITFNAAKTNFFDPIINRLQKTSSAMRGFNSDYLAYAIMDKVIDMSFPILQYYGDKLDELDEKTLNPKVKDLPLKIHNLKREILTLKRLVLPESDIVGSLINDDYDFITDETKSYLKDCLDHSLRIIEMVEIYRETASGIMELFLSISASYMNDIIKVLTIISTIFIPLGVIAGIYGMNFENMPELHFKYGYFTALSVMFFIIIAMLVYFWKKGWLSKE